MTGMFVGIHAMLASLTDIPELAITDQEGDAFMKAAAGCMRHYGVAATQKTIDHIALVGCVVSMYGPRAFAVRQRLKEAQRGDNVTPLRGTVPMEVITPSHA